MHPDESERALGWLLTECVIPEALRKKKALERKARQKAAVRDLQASAGAGGADAYTSGYSTRRKERVSYNVNAYDGLF